MLSWVIEDTFLPGLPKDAAVVLLICVCVSAAFFTPRCRSASLPL